MLAFLLPISSAFLFPSPAATTFATDDHVVLEQTLSAAVHARVAAGWTLADLTSEGEDTAIVVLAHGQVSERHVVEVTYDRGVQRARYHVEAGGPVERGDYVYPFYDQVVTDPRGVLTVEPVCNSMTIGGHIVERRATGAAAGTLAARRLRAAADLEAVVVEGDTITFTLDEDGKDQARDRIVALRVDGAGQVISAEVRKVSGVWDGHRYARRRALRRALDGRAVTAIGAVDGEVTLVLGDRRFAIDPDGDAFVAHEPSDAEGCGC